MSRIGGEMADKRGLSGSTRVPAMARERPLQRGGVGWDRAFRGWAAADSPVLAYYVLLGAALALFVIGLVMVLSASMITSIKDDGSAYTVFLKQLLYGGIGLVGAGTRLPGHRPLVEAAVGASTRRRRRPSAVGLHISGCDDQWDPELGASRFHQPPTLGIG